MQEHDKAATSYGSFVSMVVRLWLANDGKFGRGKERVWGQTKLQGAWWYARVFICILGEDTGKLIDKRDLKRGIVPSVASMMKRPSSELIDLWIKALKGQIQALKESKSEENPKLLKALQTELKTAESSNREKIENACKRQNKRK